jgi:DNA-directed RNA polymerase specialized sigma24 family protein
MAAKQIETRDGLSPIVEDERYKEGRSAMASTSADELDLDQALRGLLALHVAEREERLGQQVKPRSTVVVLADAGLSYGSIAPLVGKTKDAVRKSVERARKDASD